MTQREIVLEALRRGPLTTAQIAAVLGANAFVAHSALRKIRARGEAHIASRVPSRGASGRSQCLWAIGPGVDSPALREQVINVLRGQKMSTSQIADELVVSTSSVLPALQRLAELGAIDVVAAGRRGVPTIWRAAA